MSELTDELEMVQEVVEHLQDHPGVVARSVETTVRGHDFTDATVQFSLKRNVEAES